MMLERSASWDIQNFTAIHHLFLTPEVVEKRKPLSDAARRAGWVGCKIRLDRIAADAKIQIIASGSIQDPGAVRIAFQRFERLNAIPANRRGWTTLTLAVVRSLQARQFTLKDLYDKEKEFSDLYPYNKNILPKIRQQMQVLRDLGYLRFLGSGIYRIVI